MNKVHFQPPISCGSIELPDLPPESLNESLPQVTYSKSKQKGENILKRSFDIFRKLSSDKSRAHVGTEADKKIGASQYEKSSVIHIKTRTQAKVSFSKSTLQNESAVRSESRSVIEKPLRTRDELNLTYLKNGLKKISQGMDDNKKNDLTTTIRQLFGDLGGEPDEKTLVELKTVTDKLSLIPEVKSASIALSGKIDDALSKKAVAASQNLVKAENIALPALDSAMLSAKAEKPREPQPKLSALDMNQDAFLAALYNSRNIDELTTAVERMAGSSQPIFNQPNPAIPLSAEDELERES